MVAISIPADWFELVESRSNDFAASQDTHRAVARYLWSFLTRKDWRKDGKTSRQTALKSVSYQELQEHFTGSNGATELARSGFFQVGSEWKKGVHTRLFQLTGQGLETLRDYIDTATAFHSQPEPPQSTIARPFGKGRAATPRTKQSQPAAIVGSFGSRDINGNTTRAQFPINQQIPVNVERLIALVEDDTASTEHRFIARQILGAADDGLIEHRYTEHTGGRMFVHGPVNLQNAPATVRNAAMSGYFDYDLVAAYPSIYGQKAEQMNISTPMLNYYLRDPKALQGEISAWIKGSNPKQVKSAILALQHFGGVSGVIEATGKKGEPFTESQANRFMSHPRVKRLRAEFMTVGKAWIAEQAAKPGRQIVNAIGKGIDRKAPQRKIIAHLLQGVEALVMEVCREHYANEIVLLMHDGFVTTSRIKTAWLERKIEQATGYRLALKCTSIDPENHPSETGVKRKSLKALKARLHAVCSAFDSHFKTVNRKGVVGGWVGGGVVGGGCGDVLMV